MPKQPNMQQMLKQVQKMQQDMAAAQESLKDERVEATTGGGMVKIIMSADSVVQAVEIDKDALDPDDVELLQDMIVAAVNEAHRKAQDVAAAKMEAATGGLGGLGGGPGGGLGLPGLGF